MDTAERQSTKYGMGCDSDVTILRTNNTPTTANAVLLFALSGILLRRFIPTWEVDHLQNIPWSEKTILSVIPRTTASGLLGKNRPGTSVRIDLSQHLIEHSALQTGLPNTDCTIRHFRTVLIVAGP